MREIYFKSGIKPTYIVSIPSVKRGPLYQVISLQVSMNNGTIPVRTKLYKLTKLFGSYVVGLDLHQRNGSGCEIGLGGGLETGFRRFFVVDLCRRLGFPLESEAGYISEITCVRQHD